MKLVYNGVELFYKRNLTGGTPILLLHGFGASSKAMDCLFLFFSKRGYDVISVDFAGFGKSEQPKTEWTIYDYAHSISAILRAENVTKPIVIGHSFGGRVAIILGASREAQKLILVDSAGIKPRRSIGYYVKVYWYKLCKKLRLPTHNLGSKDYKTLSPVMKKTFVNVVNEHLDGYLPTIDVPTLILFGKYDKETPPYMAKKLNEGIKNSKLKFLQGGHFSYVDDFLNACALMEEFLCQK